MRHLTWVTACAVVLIPSAAASQADSLAASRAGQAADSITAQDGLYNRPFIISTGGTTVGGYLEANSNHFKDEGVGNGFSMEMRRFNIFLFSSISPRVRFLAELEFERGAEEIGFETALIDFRVNPALLIRAGIIIPPIGFLNQNHDSPKWNFVDRPLVTTEIIPSTLAEVGFGILGKVFPAGLTVSYDLYLTNGLQDGVVGNDQGRTHIPSGKSKDRFEGDNNGSPAVSGRVGLRKPGWGEVGGSFYTGHYNAFRVEGDIVDEKRRVSMFALDGQSRFSWGEVRAEFVLAQIDVPESLSELFADRQWGGHVDLVVPVWHGRLSANATSSVLELNMRLERVDLNVGTFTRTGAKIYDETTAWVPGLSFRPSRDTVFRFNYRREWSRDLTGNPTTVRAGYQLGFAAYF
jgi:hypothetical protein